LCLAVPARVEEVRDTKALVDFGGVRREVDVTLVEECSVGDYVIVHAGFAIQIMDEEDAQETLALLRELEAAATG
jgi:hydrogenase expression/formation protein HypC